MMRQTFFFCLLFCVVTSSKTFREELEHNVEKSVNHLEKWLSADLGQTDSLKVSRVNFSVSNSSELDDFCMDGFPFSHMTHLLTRLISHPDKVLKKKIKSKLSVKSLFVEPKEKCMTKHNISEADGGSGLGLEMLCRGEKIVQASAGGAGLLQHQAFAALRKYDHRTGSGVVFIDVLHGGMRINELELSFQPGDVHIKSQKSFVPKDYEHTTWEQLKNKVKECGRDLHIKVGGGGGWKQHHDNKKEALGFGFTVEMGYPAQKSPESSKKVAEKQAPKEDKKETVAKKAEKVKEAKAEKKEAVAEKAEKVKEAKAEKKEAVAEKAEKVKEAKEAKKEASEKVPFSSEGASEEPKFPNETGHVEYPSETGHPEYPNETGHAKSPMQSGKAVEDSSEDDEEETLDFLSKEDMSKMTHSLKKSASSGISSLSDKISNAFFSAGSTGKCSKSRGVSCVASEAFSTLNGVTDSTIKLSLTAPSTASSSNFMNNFEWFSIVSIFAAVGVVGFFITKTMKRRQGYHGIPMNE